MLHSIDFRRRAHAASLHLLISGIVAILAAALVFGIWYPGIYRVLAGGSDLFILITSIDVVLGPLLTFVVFNSKKGWPHLRRDLAVIGLIQLTALIYGLYTVWAARPVATVFEVDRFRIVTAAQVYLPELSKARPEYQKLPNTGPWLLGTRIPEFGTETVDTILMAISGFDRAERPLFWQSYSESIPTVLANARSLALLLSKRPEIASDVRSNLQSLKVDEKNVSFLPIMGRGGDWVVLIDNRGQLIHYVHTDGFF